MLQAIECTFADVPGARPLPGTSSSSKRPVHCDVTSTGTPKSKPCNHHPEPTGAEEVVQESLLSDQMRTYQNLGSESECQAYAERHGWIHCSQGISPAPDTDYSGKNSGTCSMYVYIYNYMYI